MAIDLSQISNDHTGEGHLDEDPIHEILLRVKAAAVTGRLTITNAAGENHMFFMRGQPVGVQLSEFFHPLGQLLLELGSIGSQTFIKAQRVISSQGRLPGQVFKELGVLDEKGLKEVLGIQSRRKAAHYCRLGNRPFVFGRGLSFLAGFNATPLDIHAVIYLAVRQQMGPASRESWLETVAGQQVRLSTSQKDKLLPAPLEEFEFGPPEERFLRRIQSEWQQVDDLAETGTLPRDEMTVLLRFLELIGNLEVRETPPPPPKPPPKPAPKAKAPAPHPASKPKSTTPTHGSRGAVASSVSTATKEPTGDDVFSTSRHNARSEATDPRVPVPDIHNVPTDVGGAPEKAPADDVFAVNPAHSVGPMPVVKKKKKRKKRQTPPPSEGISAETSITRKEKTVIAAIPTIVIDDE